MKEFVNHRNAYVSRKNCIIERIDGYGNARVGTNFGNLL